MYTSPKQKFYLRPTIKFSSKCSGSMDFLLSKRSDRVSPVSAVFSIDTVEHSPNTGAFNRNFGQLMHPCRSQLCGKLGYGGVAPCPEIHPRNYGGGTSLTPWRSPCWAPLLSAHHPLELVLGSRCCQIRTSSVVVAAGPQSGPPQQWPLHSGSHVQVLPFPFSTLSSWKFSFFLNSLSSSSRLNWALPLKIKSPSNWIVFSLMLVGQLCPLERFLVCLFPECLLWGLLFSVVHPTSWVCTAASEGYIGWGWAPVGLHAHGALAR